MTNELTDTDQVRVVLALVSVYAGRELADNYAPRRLGFAEVGISSLALASVIVELEDRLGREFDFEAFAGVETVADLLGAIGLPAVEGATE